MTGLIIILLLVLVLPFTMKAVEDNLEIFLFSMGVAAVLFSGVLDRPLMVKALEDPIKIAITVLIAGLLFKWLLRPFENLVSKTGKSIPYPLFFALVVIVLGFLSSVITAIIAALVLVNIVTFLRLDRKSELRLVIISCFSIGLGATLTPIGEPLSTIVVSKLNGDFLLLFRLIGPEVVIGVLMMGVFAALFIQPQPHKKGLSGFSKAETYQEILNRSIKIYLFVMGLTLLGAGFEPMINMYMLQLNPFLLYWINMISAILDNATLAAAEISPAMDYMAIKAILLGLITSGGMLIPGNIPNIISAGKLNITSTEWAKFGVPFGLMTMVVYFVVILYGE
ncbi:cation transporter [Bacillus canaveralius]|uniref:Cation transporter n=1 Tax=Bacillus canaveralius TaxID=1403243 RepID=A0A2N5GKG1_9BACI|nr:DUF1646 family protein [Bacillus canaveralius]PLR81960.1 cation transporter [Bacillus canaveralius]PLR99346.1 cation transporter [Bacillus canaveralius]RSK46933.1 DUF1646 domain-containing protein [Bacillus canaveralius]